MVQLTKTNILKNVNSLSLPGILNNYTGSTNAYSLRKINKDYTGSAIRVRRSYDNAETNIGFSGREFDSQTCLDYCVSPEIQALYGARMNFSGPNSNNGFTVGSAGGDPYTFNGKTKIEMRGQFFLRTMPTLQTDVIFSHSVNSSATGFSVGVTTGNVFRVGGRSVSTDAFQQVTHSTTILPGRIYEFMAYLDYTAKTAGIAVREVGSGTSFAYEVTGSLAFGNNTYTLGTPVFAATYGFLPGTANTTWDGSFWDISVLRNDTLVSSYLGYGNSNSNWEDQTGSIDGTVVNSPAVLTGQGFNGFVTTWYDQAVSVNATQTTATRQPKIVSNGAIVLGVGDKPAIQTDGVDDFMVFTSVGGTERTTFIAMKQITYDTTNRNRIFSETRFVDISNNSGYLLESRGDVASDPLRFTLQNNGSSVQDSTADPTISSSIFSILIGSTSDLYQNGNLLTTGANTMDGTYSEGVFGASTAATFPIVARYQEIIVYNSYMPTKRLGIEALINSYYGAY